MKPGMLLVVVLLIAAGIAYWITRDNPTVIGGGVDPFAQACGSKPASDIGLSARDFELAGVSIGEATVGQLSVSTKPEVYEALTKTAKSAQVVEYLICVAEERGQIKRGSAEQSNYLRQLFLYFNSNPTAKEFEEWQKSNPFPKGSARLEIPDLSNIDGRQVLSFQNDIIRTITLINAGNEKTLAWLEEFPSTVFYPDPGIGPWEIAPGAGMKLTIVFTHMTPDRGSYLFSFRTPDQRIDAEIWINYKVAAGLYQDLARNIEGASDPVKAVGDRVLAVQSIEPNSANQAAVKLILANVFASVGKTDKAAETIQEVDRASPERRNNLFFQQHLAQLLFDAGEFDGYLEATKRVNELEDTTAQRIRDLSQDSQYAYRPGWEAIEIPTIAEYIPDNLPGLPPLLAPPLLGPQPM